eukprot:TRINITY_DN69510_c0_g1_i1.p1 TRINITY_DN69510_c0_g1~~TRINITY_DN69510_c0_g1_i1.p1  ORF type:complete len:167 (-),score=26.07 TRINITY_DN69510_c0_g1_i1:230-730(-)
MAGTRMASAESVMDLHDCMRRSLDPQSLVLLQEVTSRRWQDKHKKWQENPLTTESTIAAPRASDDTRPMGRRDVVGMQRRNSRGWLPKATGIVGIPSTPQASGSRRNSFSSSQQTFRREMSRRNSSTSALGREGGVRLPEVPSPTSSSPSYFGSRGFDDRYGRVEK